jgi:hypothetical protein
MVLTLHMVIKLHRVVYKKILQVDSWRTRVFFWSFGMV